MWEPFENQIPGMFILIAFPVNDLSAAEIRKSNLFLLFVFF